MLLMSSPKYKLNLAPCQKKTHPQAGEKLCDVIQVKKTRHELAAAACKCSPRPTVLHLNHRDHLYIFILYIGHRMEIRVPLPQASTLVQQVLLKVQTQIEQDGHLGHAKHRLTEHCLWLAKSSR